MEDVHAPAPRDASMPPVGAGACLAISAAREIANCGRKETAIDGRVAAMADAPLKPAPAANDAGAGNQPWRKTMKMKTCRVDVKEEATASAVSSTSDEGSESESDDDSESDTSSSECPSPVSEVVIAIDDDVWAKAPATFARPVTEALPLLKSSPASTVSELVYEDDRLDVGKEFRRLCELSWPVIFTYVLEEFPEIISLTLVGHMDSPLTNVYVDAAALSTMFVNLTAVALCFGLGTALDTLCSQAFGAGKPMKMGIYFQTGVVALGIAMIPVFVVNWYTEPFLLWMHQPPEVAKLAARFTRWVLPGLPFMYVYELLKKILEAQNVVTPMVNVAILSNIVNLVFGVYLTWYTPLGFDGAAIARTIANILLPLALIPCFCSKNSELEAWWPGWNLRRAWKAMPKFLTLGVPGLLMVMLEWWAFEVMQIAVGWLPNGVVAISVQSVLANISTTTFNFFFGISVATSICVGNYVGSAQPAHAKLVSMLGMALALGVSLVLTVFILVMRSSLPSMFLNDPTAIAYSAHALLFLLPYQQFDALNCIMQGVFRGTGRMQLATYINFFGWIAIGLPAGGMLGFMCGLGVEGMWLGLTIGATVAVVLSGYKIWRTDWNDMADEARLRAS